MRIGIVEFFVDIEDCKGLRFDCVPRAIREDPGRESLVQRAVEASGDCDVLVLPGWTLVADTPPGWIVDASWGRTVVLECIWSGKPASHARKRRNASQRRDEVRLGDWDAYVLHDGQVVIGPAPQRLAMGEDVGSNPATEALCADILWSGSKPPGRVWSHPSFGKTLLLVCGEANIAGGGPEGHTRCYHRDIVAKYDVDERWLRGFPLVLNPSHVPGGPQALRDKRAWLSRSGLLVNTANSHSAGWTRAILEKKKIVGWDWGRAARKSAKIWRNGKASDDSLKHARGDLLRDGYRLMTLDWKP